jgi:hypothetical protein
MALAPTKKLLLEILPDEHVKELVDAVEGAIDYWLLPDLDLDRDSLPEGAVFAGLAAETGSETEPPDKVVITLEQIREAYGKLLDLDQPWVHDTIHGYIIDSYRHRNKKTQLIDLAEIDGDAYDVIMQVAAFGKTIYG